MKSPLATLILRIPPSLHQQLKQDARAGDTSLNKHCRVLLSRKPKGSSAREISASLTLAAGSGRALAPWQDLAARVIETWGDDIEGLVLFGSCARGRQTANSDIDLLVVLDGSATLDRDLYSRWQLRAFDGREVAPLFVQIPGKGGRIGGLWFEVALDGIVLYDRSLHLSRFLAQVRNLLAGGRVIRRVTHGHPYWVHSEQNGRDLTSAGES
jgi:predicted nucleotidyltransferase